MQKVENDLPYSVGTSKKKINHKVIDSGETIAKEMKYKDFNRLAEYITQRTPLSFLVLDFES